MNKGQYYQIIFRYLISIETIDRKEQVFALVRDNFIIGFMVLKPYGQDVIELKKLYLSSTVRGRGLGDILLNFAKENNYKYIRLETTSKFKQAVSLYKKYGFKIMTDVEMAIGHDLAFEKSLGF